MIIEILTSAQETLTGLDWKQSVVLGSYTVTTFITSLWKNVSNFFGISSTSSIRKSNLLFRDSRNRGPYCPEKRMV